MLNQCASSFKHSVAWVLCVRVAPTCKIPHPTAGTTWPSYVVTLCAGEDICACVQVVHMLPAERHGGSLPTGATQSLTQGSSDIVLTYLIQPMFDEGLESAVYINGA
jgi:hypothetical protein